MFGRSRESERSSRFRTSAACITATNAWQRNACLRTHFWRTTGPDGVGSEAQFQSETELPLVDAIAAEVRYAGNAREIIQVGDSAVRIQDHIGNISAGIRK